MAVKPTFAFWDNSHLVKMSILYPYCWIQYVNMLLRISMSAFMKDISVWNSFFFFLQTFYFFNHGNAGFRKWPRKCSLLLFSRRVCVTHYFECQYLIEFIIKIQFLWQIQGYSDFLFLLMSTLATLCFPENLSISNKL